jgi:hypothetical protein
VNSSDCIDVLDFISLVKTTVVDFSDMTEWLEVSESVSEIDNRRFGRALNASLSGMMIRTCWQTTSDGINLQRDVRVDEDLYQIDVTYHPAGAKNLLMFWTLDMSEYVKAIQSGVPGRLTAKSAM